VAPPARAPARARCPVRCPPCRAPCPSPPRKSSHMKSEMHCCTGRKLFIACSHPAVSSARSASSYLGQGQKATVVGLVPGPWAVAVAVANDSHSAIINTDPPRCTRHQSAITSAQLTADSCTTTVHSSTPTARRVLAAGSRAGCTQHSTSSISVAWREEKKGHNAVDCVLETMEAG
jgi:hypothetical protein